MAKELSTQDKNYKPHQDDEQIVQLFFEKAEVEKQAEWKTDCKSFLMDLKILMKEYYVATFSTDGTSLKVSFLNGQNLLFQF